MVVVALHERRLLVRLCSRGCWHLWLARLALSSRLVCSRGRCRRSLALPPNSLTPETEARRTYPQWHQKASQKWSFSSKPGACEGRSIVMRKCRKTNWDPSG